MKNNRVPFMGIYIDNMDANEIVDHVFECVEKKTPVQIVGVNVDQIVTVNKSATSMRIFRDAELVFIDGKPIKWMCSLLGRKVKARITGPDLMEYICEKGAAKGLKIYLLGAGPGVAKKCGEILEQKYPGIHAVGHYSPPFGFQNDKEEMKKINTISCPNEGLFIHAKKNVIIPNGMPDEAIFPNEVKSQNFINLLFIGLLEETKGELDLLRSVSILKRKGIKSIVRIAGEFKSQEYKKHFFDVVEEYNLSNDVEYLGIIRGDKKIDAFRNSDIFCFPSYFHSESFPLVLIEAMSFGLPIVTTKWRGIVDMVQEGYNGFLVDIKSPELLASQIELLYENINLRKKISINSRKEFEQKYSLQRHLEQMNELFNII